MSYVTAKIDNGIANTYFLTKYFTSSENYINNYLQSLKLNSILIHFPH